jgi:hypothetical protein
MPTLDDDPITTPGTERAEPEFGSEVHELLTAAACSTRVRVQSLGRKAQTALDDLKAAVKREAQIAAAEAELARLRRGE